MNNNLCIVTGCNGDIGRSIVASFKKKGFTVLGIDKHKNFLNNIDIPFQYDLKELINKESYFAKFQKDLDKTLLEYKLRVVVNNAAIQNLSKNNISDIKKFRDSLDVNTIAPLLIYRLVSKSLSKNKGCLINIGSIHSSLTKDKFGLYAASKAALKSLTSSIAIENKGKILTYLIEPAAIDTKMLRSGIKDKEKFNKLANFHPSGTIGSPDDIANIISFLYDAKIKFLHGTCIDLSGGIKNILHDPDQAYEWR